MGSPADRIFTGVDLTKKGLTFQPGHDAAALKTYRYLRLGMLVAVAALSYSIIEEYSQSGVHCFLGSISGYYYTPVHPVFIGVMVGIGLALIAIKGRTAIEDACLSLAGMMAPIVALVPTGDDVRGVCRPQMLSAGHYQPDTHTSFGPASISNDLHAYVLAGYVAIGLLLIAALLQWRHSGSTEEYTSGTWITLGIAFALVLTGSILLRWGYEWVLQGHARAACAMFLLLAVAAITNGVLGLRRQHTKPVYVWSYLAVGSFMIAAGIVFLVTQVSDRSALNGHLVFAIEIVEILAFVVFWAVQTIERWNDTV